MSILNGLVRRLQESAAHVSRIIKEKGPSAILTKFFGPLPEHDKTSLRTWALGGVSVGVLTIGLLACAGTLPAASPVVTIGGITHFVTQLDYFDPVRKDASTLFTLLGASSAVALAGTSAMNAKVQYGKIQYAKDGLRFYNLMLLKLHSSSGSYRAYSAVKKVAGLLRNQKTDA